MGKKMESPEPNETSHPDDTVEELPLKTEIKVDIKNMNFKEKLKYLKENITVEPVLAMFVMPSVLTSMATQNLNLDKACRVNLGFGDEVCTALRLRQRSNYSMEEVEVQKLIASVQAWKSVAHVAIPTLLLLFIGAWSDRTGRRKICMLLPIFGEIMTCLLNMMNTFLFYQVPVEWTVFMEVVFPSITGGWYTMFLGTFSYLVDITPKETRTFRLGVLSLCMTIGFPIGMGLSGVLLKWLGYYGVFSISATLKADSKQGCTRFLKEFFDFKNVQQTFAIVFKKGPNNRRLRICLILTAVCLHFGPLWGELSIMYIFVRYQFNWNEVQYSIYSTYSLITHSLGTFFSIGVLSKRLKADDAVLGIAATCSKICGALVLMFAQTDYVIYIAPLVEILNGSQQIAVRSIASKLVSNQELGKVYSLFGVVETVMPLVFTPLYARFYIVTLPFLPGAVFFISILATIPAVAIFGWFYHDHRRHLKQQRLEIPADLAMKPCDFHHEKHTSSEDNLG